MKELLTLPTFIIFKLKLLFLPNDHFLKKSDGTLKDWAENSTELNDAFSFILWLQLLCLIFTGLIIWLS
jgi:hypothetical protein